MALGAALGPVVAGVSKTPRTSARIRSIALSVRNSGYSGGAKTFVNKGTNGRWRDVLTADDVAFYERTLAAQLTPDCAHWLTTGHLPH